jgi:hypothetical protein
MVSPSGRVGEDYFSNCTGESEGVNENLRALESIFVESLSTVVVHPNVQRNLEEILQMNQQQSNENR